MLAASLTILRFVLWTLILAALALGLWYYGNQIAHEAGWVHFLERGVDSLTGEEFGTPENMISSPGLRPVFPIAIMLIIVGFGFAGIFDFPKFRPFWQFHRGLVAAILVIFGTVAIANIWRWMEIGSVGEIRGFTGPYVVDDVVAKSPDLALVLRIAFFVAVAWIVVSFNWFFPNGPGRHGLGLLYRYGLTLLFVPGAYVFVMFFIVTLGGRGW